MLNLPKGFWFPGPWIGGVSLVLAPLCLMAGVLLRIRFDFFFPDQLQAYDTHQTILFLSYSLFLAGNVLLWPGILTLTRLIGESKPLWAFWGGSLVIFGLFARTFHAGIDHLAFQLVPILGLEAAVQTVSESYGAYHVMSAVNLAILIGWIVLAVGGYLSKVFNLFSAIALALMSSLMLGVLKGTSTTSILAISGLCVALIPLGFLMLKEAWHNFSKRALLWVIVTVLFLLISCFLGLMG